MSTQRRLSLTTAAEAWPFAREGMGMALSAMRGMRRGRNPHSIHLGVTR